MSITCCSNGFSQDASSEGAATNEQNELLKRADEAASGVSPVRRIERNSNPGTQDDGPGGRGGPGRRPDQPSMDGGGNNLGDVEMNRAETSLLRFVAPDYADGFAAMAGEGRQSARRISNLVNAQVEDAPNPLGLSDFLWQWGQFVDHDIDLTDGTEPPEPADIAVPSGDAWFDPASTGAAVIGFNRSLYAEGTGGDPTSPRQQVNEITGWIDASNIYGSSRSRSQALRTLDGTGRLKTSAGNLLPFNVEGLSNAGGSSAELFVAGDVRANEHVGLTAMHTLFVREHNRLAEDLAAENPEWGGQHIFDQARRLVIGMMQVITFDEFLPALLGENMIAPYQAYDETADAQIMNVFSTAAYRLGHTLLSPTLLRLDDQMREITAGHLSLADAFFAPHRLVDEGGIEPILRGLSDQACQDFDVFVIDEVRNFLFGPPGAGGFDLAALNIQRGRDHGLPSYNDIRTAFGLEPMDRFAGITRDRRIARRLAQAYDTPAEVDAWVGGLAEDPLPGAMAGELVGTIVARQFTLLRDGDRHWYQRILNDADQQFVEQSRLADVIRRNTTIGPELGDRDVFRVDQSR